MYVKKLLRAGWLPPNRRSPVGHPEARIDLDSLCALPPNPELPFLAPKAASIIHWEYRVIFRAPYRFLLGCGPPIVRKPQPSCPSWHFLVAHRTDRLPCPDDVPR